MDGYAILVQFIGAVILLVLGAIQLFYPEVKMYNVVMGKPELTIWAKVYLALMLCAVSLFGIGSYMQWDVSKEAKKDFQETTEKLNRCDTLNQQTQHKIDEQIETINTQGRKLDELDAYLIAKGINPQTLFVTNNYSGTIKQRRLTDTMFLFLTKNVNKKADITLQSISKDKESQTVLNELAEKLRSQRYNVGQVLGGYGQNFENLFDTITTRVGATGIYPNGKKDTGNFIITVYPATNTN